MDHVVSVRAIWLKQMLDEERNDMEKLLHGLHGGHLVNPQDSSLICTLLAKKDWQQ